MCICVWWGDVDFRTGVKSEQRFGRGKEDGQVGHPEKEHHRQRKLLKQMSCDLKNHALCVWLSVSKSVEVMKSGQGGDQQ
jgi:hypothetical protein